MNKLNFFYSSNNSWAGFIARVAAGIVLLPHGAQKLLGLFGGQGPGATVQFFTDVMHLPWLVAWLVIIIEFFGALALILGVLSRFWASLITALFLGIVIMVHSSNGFFMNWMGTQQGEGFEYSILMIGLCVITMITDGGKYKLLNLGKNKN